MRSKSRLSPSADGAEERTVNCSAPRKASSTSWSRWTRTSAEPGQYESRSRPDLGKEQPPTRHRTGNAEGEPGATTDPIRRVALRINMRARGEFFDDQNQLRKRARRDRYRRRDYGRAIRWMLDLRAARMVPASPSRHPDERSNW